MNKKFTGKSLASLVLTLGLLIPQIASATIYRPGETLEPDCSPGSPNCGVATFPLSLGTSTPIGNSILTIQATSTDSILATLRAFAGQTGSLLRVQDNSGSDLFTINSSGSALFSNSLAVTGNLTLGGQNGPLQANTGLVTSVPSIAVQFGGTGLTTAPAFGAILVGDGLGGYAFMSTSSLSVPGTGTVTSVALTAPTGLTVLGSPITGAGTLALSFTPGFMIPLVASTTEYDEAFENRITSASSPLSISNHHITIDTSGNWSGTLNGQPGSFYLDARNLTNAGAPFYAFFSATTTDALAQGITNRYYSDALVAAFLNSSTTIPKTAAANTFTGANVFNGAVTFDALNGPLQANAGLVSATSSIGVQYGGTGLNSMPTFGQLLVGNSSGGFSLLATSTLGLGGSSGTVSSVALTAPTGLTVSGSPITSSGALALTLTPGFVIPLTASTSEYDIAFANRITSSTAPLSISNRVISLSTTGDWTGLLDGQEGNFYLDARNQTNFGTPFYSFFSATNTDALAPGITNRYYNDALVQSFINGSTTIPKSFAANVFTGANAFSGAFTLDGFNGPLQANGGLVSATSSISVIYGGTGLSSAPGSGQLLVGNALGGYSLLGTSTLGINLADTTGSLSVARGGTGLSAPGLGQLLVGNALGGYSLFATSTLGINLADTIGSLSVARGGTGATSFGQGWIFSSGDGNALSASTSPAVAYITATSTTATSTFANGIAIQGGGLRLGTITSCHNLGTDSLGNLECELGQFSIDVRKSADQSTTTITLADDTELSFPIGANETWVFRYDLLYTTGASPDIKLAISAPTGATCDYALGQFSAAISAGATACGTALTVNDGSVANEPLPLAGSVSNGGTAGVIHLQFAQNTANATAATIQRGSAMSAFRVSGGADLAEVYYAKDISLMPGTVVALDSSLPGGVRRALATDEAIGIVSTKPGVVIGDTVGARDGVPVIVALAGRVPVKVSTEGGDIEAGDYLVPSSIAGVAMKGGNERHSIGLAMTEYSDNGVGIIMTFIKNSVVGDNVALLGNTSSASTSLDDIQGEAALNPVAIIARKITDGVKFITDFVAARVTAIRGYFDEVFARRIHTEQICFTKSDAAAEVCVDADKLGSLLQGQTAAAAGTAATSSSTGTTPVMPPVAPPALPTVMINPADTTGGTGGSGTGGTTDTPIPPAEPPAPTGEPVTPAVVPDSTVPAVVPEAVPAVAPAEPEPATEPAAAPAAAPEPASSTGGDAAL